MVQKRIPATGERSVVKKPFHSTHFARDGFSAIFSGNDNIAPNQNGRGFEVSTNDGQGDTVVYSPDIKTGWSFENERGFEVYFEPGILNDEIDILTGSILFYGFGAKIDGSSNLSGFVNNNTPGGITASDQISLSEGNDYRLRVVYDGSTEVTFKLYQESIVPPVLDDTLTISTTDLENDGESEANMMSLNIGSGSLNILKFYQLKVWQEEYDHSSTDDASP